MIFSVYAPVQKGAATGPLTDRFYEQLSESTQAAKAKGEILIVGGDMNAPILQSDAPELIGPWASAVAKPHARNLIRFMCAQKLWAPATFQKQPWRKYSLGKGRTQKP